MIILQDIARQGKPCEYIKSFDRLKSDFQSLEKTAVKGVFHENLD